MEHRPPARVKTAKRSGPLLTSYDRTSESLRRTGALAMTTARESCSTLTRTATVRRCPQARFVSLFFTEVFHGPTTTSNDKPCAAHLSPTESELICVPRHSWHVCSSRLKPMFSGPWIFSVPRKMRDLFPDSAKMPDHALQTHPVGEGEC